MLSYDQPDIDNDGVLYDKGLWRIGFHVSALYVMSMLSGIVDVRDVLWLHDKEVLIFVVSSLDKTSRVLEGGVFRASSIDGYQPNKQGLMVDWTRGRSFAAGEN